MESKEFKELIEVLNLEWECCLGLVEISRNEQRALVKHDTAALNEHIQDMQRTVTRMAELQAQRERLLPAAVKRFAAGQPATLEVLARVAPNGSELEEVAGRLLTVARTLSQLNQQTIYLINFSLDLVDRQMGIWKGAIARDEGYTQEGASTSASAPSLLESKA